MFLCPFHHLLGMSPPVNGHLRVGGPCWQALMLTAITPFSHSERASQGGWPLLAGTDAHSRYPPQETCLSAVFQMKTPWPGDIAGSSEVLARISKVPLPSPPDLESKLLIRNCVRNCIVGTELEADCPLRGICGNHCLWYL